MMMRTAVPVAVALALFCTASGWGQDRQGDDECEYSPREAYLQVNLSDAERAYLEALSHSVAGVVDCALGEVARIKVAQLVWDSPAMRKKLDELSRKGTTLTIRYKASLVRLLFDTPSLFAEESTKDFRTPAQLYRALSRRLEESLLEGGIAENV
jgi:hypothetical protein